MSEHDEDLRDPMLARHLKESWAGRKAPAAWVHDAMAVPARSRVEIREEPWLLALLPHLLGLALLIGLGVAFALRPDIRQAGASSLSTDWLEIPVSVSVPLLLAVPALMLALAEASRGFPTLRRWL